MKEQTAQNLADALENLEQARIKLVQADAGEKAEAGTEYVVALRELTPPLTIASREFDLADAGFDENSEDSARAMPVAGEASPGVPLVEAPNTVITPSNIEGFETAKYRRTDLEDEVIATTFAFARGTVVELSDLGERALADPSRILVTAGGLGACLEELFTEHYERVNEAQPEQPSETPADSETPIEGE